MPSLSEAILECDYVLIDNDGVTYPITQIILDDFAIAVARAAQHHVPELSIESGVALAWESWNTHRYGLQSFVDIYGIDLDDLHERYHDYCDIDLLEVDPFLPQAFPAC